MASRQVADGTRSDWAGCIRKPHGLRAEYDLQTLGVDLSDAKIEPSRHASKNPKKSRKLRRATSMLVLQIPRTAWPSGPARSLLSSCEPK